MTQQTAPAPVEDTESQNKMVLRYLQAGERLTPIEALRMFGTFRLGARIFDLRAKGFDIKTQIVSVVNQFGKTVRVAEYFLNP